MSNLQWTEKATGNSQWPRANRRLRSDLQLNATTEQHRLCDHIAVAMEELNADERIPAHAAEDGLLGQDNAVAVDEQVHIELADDDRGMGAFDIVAQNHPGFDPTQLDLASQGDLRTRRVVAPDFIDDG